MKAPSKNVSASLRGQRPQGRGPEMVEVQEMRRGGVSMTVPGEGGVQDPPGEVNPQSAKHYTAPMRKFGGG